MIEMANDATYLLLKRWHVLLAILAILIGFGIQIGLSIGKFDSLDRRVSTLESTQTEIQSLTVELAKARVEIEGLRRDLEKMR